MTQVISMCAAPDADRSRRGRPPGVRNARDPVKEWEDVRCLLWRVYDGLSVSDVARRIGKSERTVIRKCQRALGYFWYPEIKEVRRLIKQSKEFF